MSPDIISSLPPVSDPTSILGKILTGDVHLAYITNDVEGAIEYFERLGIAPWGTVEMPLRGMDNHTVETTSRVAFARMTGRMYELIEPASSVTPLFPRPEGTELAIIFHHLGAMVAVDAVDIEEAARVAGLTTYRRSGPRGEIVFIDMTASLGHWLEVLCSPPSEEAR